MAEKATGRDAACESADGPRDTSQDSPAAKAGKLKAIAHRINHDDRKLQLSLLAFMVLYYGVLLLAAWGHSARTVSLRLTFNSMLDHLMRGQFDVDPQVVGAEEGFLRNGRVYAYFGIWCALLRLPLWIFRRMDIDLTLWSCLAAACLAGIAKVRTVLLLRRHGMQNPMARWAVGLMLAYVLLGGTGIGLLNASIYAEVILWACAFATVFVYLAVKGVVNRRFDLPMLCWMALCAGLALNTRVSTGIGLILAMVLLLFMLTFEYGAAATSKPSLPIRRFALALTTRRTLLPGGVLAALMTVSGTVNYFRWGNPATFANWDLYLGWAPWPNRSAWWLSPYLSLIHAYGTFNIVRIPFNLVYYFFPFWALQNTTDDVLLATRWGRTMCEFEMPPSSFFLTDMLAFCFIALLAVALWRRRPRGLPPAGRWAIAVAIGLLAPCILMLTAIWAAYRYRLEFYPEIDFIAFMGLYLTLTDETMLALFGRIRRWMATALTVSIAFSFLALFLIDVGQSLPWHIGGRGLVDFYIQVTTDHYHKVIAPHFGFHR